MSLLRLAVLGPPQVFHEGRRLSFALRKAQALLLYLAVEGGMHSRSKLAALLWQVADVGVQAGVQALEEAVGSGMLRQEQAGAGRPGSYRFAHDLVREVVYTELGEARRLVLHQRALARLET